MQWVFLNQSDQIINTSFILRAFIWQCKLSITQRRSHSGSKKLSQDPGDWALPRRGMLPALRSNSWPDQREKKSHASQTEELQNYSHPRKGGQVWTASPVQLCLPSICGQQSLAQGMLSLPPEMRLQGITLKLNGARRKWKSLLEMVEGKHGQQANWKWSKANMAGHPAYWKWSEANMASQPTKNSRRQTWPTSQPTGNGQRQTLPTTRGTT